MDLKTARESKAMTQAKLSSITGIVQPTISSIECGNLLPTEHQKYMLSVVLGTIDWDEDNSELNLCEIKELLEIIEGLIPRLGLQKTLKLFVNRSNNDIRRSLGIFRNPDESLRLYELIKDDKNMSNRHESKSN